MHRSALMRCAFPLSSHLGNAILDFPQPRLRRTAISKFSEATHVTFYPAVIHGVEQDQPTVCCFQQSHGSQGSGAFRAGAENPDLTVLRCVRET